MAAASRRSLTASRRSTRFGFTRPSPSPRMSNGQHLTTLRSSRRSWRWTWTRDGSTALQTSCATRSTASRVRASGLLIEDLLALPTSQPILVEGFTLLPRLVAPLVSHPHQAVWLIATPEFRRAAFESRGSTYDIPRKTSDPERALENLLERDRLFTEDVAREAAALRLPVIDVDIGVSINGLAARVSEALDLP